MSRLSKNILYNLAGQGLLFLLGFVATKYIFKQLGADALGVIFFTLSLNVVLRTIFEMGISSTTVREVASHFHDDPKYIHDFIRTASLFYWSAYLLLAVGIFYGAPLFVNHWINLESMDTATAILILQVLGTAVLVSLPRSLYASLFRGLERMEFNNIIDVTANILQQFGIIVILAVGGGILPVVYWLAASFVIWTFSYLLAARGFFPWQAFIPGYYSDVVKKNIRYSSNMIVTSISGLVIVEGDKVIISKFLTVGLLGYYGFAYSVVSRVTFLTRAVAQAAFPLLSSLFKTGKQDSMMSQYHKLHDLICFGTVPIFAAIPFVALPVFGFVFNPEVARMLLFPTIFLAVGFYMNGTLNLPHVFSLSVGKPEIAAKLNFLSMFISLPATIGLIYFWGIAGAGFSWVLHQLFAYAYAIPRICSECFGIPVREWYWHVIKILALTGSTYGVAWTILGLTSKYSVLSLTTAYMGATIAFLTASYFMIGEELRESFLGHLKIAKSSVLGIT